ncbi:MAG: HypC/HybG/HupF family hydrogenase formation chaperone [Pyrinomonadaceae bacterium MAG19_C2-C3]|nr:HypC/HybG/HupF family hydrogenase formation chaperone [Pyrinomonadaceae bacterium MAG19_C2-C3]
MCLAIPGKIVEFVDFENHIAKVDVGGVRRNVNIGMLDEDGISIGDYVLIHVGFAMSKIDEQEAAETLRLLKEIDLYEEEVEGFKTSLE